MSTVLIKMVLLGRTIELKYSDARLSISRWVTLNASTILMGYLHTD